MGKNDRCCVGSCDNDTRYPDKLVKRNHVEKLRWHRFTEDPGKWKQWISLISKGRADFNPGPWTYVCSNHFVDDLATERKPVVPNFGNQGNEINVGLLHSQIGRDSDGGLLSSYSFCIQRRTSSK
eukprot:gene17081-8598_t